MPEAPSTTHRLIPADFYTPSYRIVGKSMVPSTGVLGLMNDPTNSFMEVLDATLARVHMPTKLVEHYEVVRLVKAQIFAVALNRREDLGPQALARGGYIRLTEFPIKVTTPVFELEGVLEWPGRFDFSAIMVEGHSGFIPVYNARLTAVLIPALKVEAPALLFNRTQVDLMALSNQKVKE
jgi:hypothetical protein